MNSELLREFVALQKEDRRLDDELKRVQSRINAIEPKLREEFALDGVQSINLDGMTCYLQRTLRASAADGNIERLAGVLHDLGLADIVKETVNSQSLSAVIREYDRDEKPLPPALAEAVKVYEMFQVRARLAT